MLLYRPLVDGDIPAGLALCRAAGWNQTREDWELFLSLGRRAGVVAVDEDGEVRGTAATIRYEDHFCWIGMVLVDPSRRGEGIGREQAHVDFFPFNSVVNIRLDDAIGMAFPVDIKKRKNAFVYEVGTVVADGGDFEPLFGKNHPGHAGAHGAETPYRDLYFFRSHFTSFDLTLILFYHNLGNIPRIFIMASNER